MLGALANKVDAVFPSSLRQLLTDVGLLVLRVSAGLMMAGHGWGKLSTWSEKVDKFPDPIGVGSTPSLALAVFAEFFCAGLVALGLATRAAAVPVVITMLVAALIVHGEDPWQRKELAVLFLSAFVTVILTGPGKFSLDALLMRKARSKE